MHDRTKNLTIRQTLVALWDANSNAWSGHVEPAAGSATGVQTTPNFPFRPGPDDPTHVQIPFVKEWDAGAKRWTITLGFAGGRQSVFTDDQWLRGRAWPFWTPRSMPLLTWSLWCFVAFGLATVVLMFVCPNVIHLDGPDLPRAFFRVFLAGMAVGGIGVFVSLVLWLMQIMMQLPQFVRQTVWSLPTIRMSRTKPQSPAAPSQAPCRTVAVISAIVRNLLLVGIWALMGVTWLSLGHHSWKRLTTLPDENTWSKCFEIVFFLLPGTMIALWITVPILVCREVWRRYRVGVQETNVARRRWSSG